MSKLHSLLRWVENGLGDAAGVVADARKIVSIVLKVPEGIEVIPGSPTVHKESVMARTVKLVKKSAAKASKGGKTAPGAFLLQDNGDDTFTVLGADAAGNAVDIAAVATLAASSDKPAVVTVDAPAGMSSAVHAALPAPAVGSTANITLTATWNDGSDGPFTIVWPQEIVASPVSGIAVKPGIPSVH